MFSKVKEASPPSSGQMSPVSQPVSSQSQVSTHVTEPVHLPTSVTSNGLNSITPSSYGDSSGGGSINPPAPPVVRQRLPGPPPTSESLSLFSDSGFPSSRHLKPVLQQNLTG